MFRLVYIFDFATLSSAHIKIYIIATLRPPYSQFKYVRIANCIFTVFHVQIKYIDTFFAQS